MANIRFFDVAKEKNKLRYPGRLALISLVVMLVPWIIIAIFYVLLFQLHLGIIEPGSFEALVVMYTVIGIEVLGCILFVIAWFWVIIIALQRGQFEWVIPLLFVGGIALPLYFISNPLPEYMKP